MCSFDGGPAQRCSFPLKVGIDRFGTDKHTLVVTVKDGFRQSSDVMLSFKLVARKLYGNIAILFLHTIIIYSILTAQTPPSPPQGRGTI